MQRMWYGIIHFAFFPSFFANCIARVKRFSHDMSLGCLQSHSSLARYELLLLLSIIIDINFFSNVSASRPSNNACELAICKCDSAAAQCLGKNTFDSRYKYYPNFLC